MSANASGPAESAPLGADVRRSTGPLGRRLALARGKAPEGAGGPGVRLLLGEVGAYIGRLKRRFQPPLELPRAQSPRVVILLPGFGTHPVRMRYMAAQLERAGHTVKRWGLGFNLGPTAENFEALARRVRDVHARYGQQVVLVGWSLGGIFARELAKRDPEMIAKVVTMGSPFSGNPYANNAWRIYELITGHSIAQPPIEVQMAVKPPVETVALWSPRDGIVSPCCTSGHPGERDRAVALDCTHIGFADSHEAIRAVAEELERPPLTRAPGSDK